MLSLPTFLKPKDLLLAYVKPAFRLRVRFFFIFEKEALEDFDLMMMPSTASAACDNTITATSAIDFLKKWR
jgi:hypothetical protein